MDFVPQFVDQYVGYAYRTFEGRDHPRCQEKLDWENLPLTSIWSPIIGCIIYLAGVVIIPKLMEDRKPFKLKGLMAIHNGLLTIISAGLCVGLIKTLVDVCYSSKHGWRTIWDDPEWEMPCTDISLYCYIFYVSKYYELIDTLFLVLKKGPVRTVQLWHHSSVMLLFWSYMEARMFAHWFLVVANTFVHIFVYGYFCCKSLNIPTPWKHLVTQLQIAQFVADMVYAVPYPFFKLSGYAAGDWAPWWIGQFIGATFIVLFGKIYLEIKAAKLQKQGMRNLNQSKSLATNQSKSLATKKTD